MRIVAPLLKLGLGGGAVYLIADQGLFSDSQKDTIEASKKITSSIPSIPVVDPYLELIPKVMSKEERINYWNSGVKFTFKALSDLPEKSKETLHRGFNYLKEEIKKQMKGAGN